MNKSSVKKLCLDLLSLLLVGAIFFFLGRELIKNWDFIKNYKLSFDPFLLAAACFVYALAFLPLSAGWFLILKYVKNPIPFIETVLYFLITQPAKYLPGKIWLAVARMKFCKKHDVPNSITLLTTGIEGFMEILAGSYISIMAIIQTNVLGKYSLLMLTLATAAGLLLLVPRVFYFFINVYLKIVKRDPVLKSQQVSFSRLLGLQAVFITGVGVMSAAQALFLMSLAQIDLKFFPLLVSIGAFTYTASILAVFTPSGLGVREGIWYVALKTMIAPPVALVFSFVSRLWIIVVEALLLFFAAPALWAKHKLHDKKTRNL